MKQKTNYEDIINLPHHVSSKRPQMPMLDRAAQFSPFAALTGYDDAIRETGRLTDEKITLDDYEKEAINAKLQFIMSHLGENRKVKLTYFEPDEKKEGGKYVELDCTIKKIDEYERQLIILNGKKIPIENLLDIELEGDNAE